MRSKDPPLSSSRREERAVVEPLVDKGERDVTTGLLSRATDHASRYNFWPGLRICCADRSINRSFGRSVELLLVWLDKILNSALSSLRAILSVVSEPGLAKLELICRFEA